MTRSPRLTRRQTLALLPLATAAPVLATAAPAAASRPSTEIIETVPGRGNVVSLTFDDGPDPEDTPALLAVLRKHRVRTVFFLWGDHALEHPALIRRIVREGHVLGNHTMHHDDMATWTRDQIRADLLEARAAIRQAVPRARIPFFRAPFGSWGETPVVAAQLGMRSVGWRLAVADWETPGTDVLVSRLTEGITPGAVVLLHDGGGDRSQTVEAVDQIIPAFKARGWRFALPPGC
jgi:peptidoglycan/xylan/chitin deacetylase (PgdA/CDA1 family)